RLPGALFIQADMEQFQPEQKFDLVFSNASVQWCDLSAVMQTTKNSLKPGGLFVYSSFGPDTHLEIARAWDMAHPGRVHHIDFLKESDHLIALKQAGFEVLNHQRQLIQPRFDSTRAMLSSVKRTGATNASSLRDKGLLSRETYARFLEYLGQPNPLELSYETLSFVARAPD
ncbi:MAG: methyltransferase domain-containing protein, partial [Pseudomonadales bacterium]